VVLVPNRLADATSPYLLQHQDNPVDWWPWGDEAFAEAARLDVPVLLSVGYAACHWCHVMAHESFEDPATAELMNTGFVNIKVDREERPDVDAVYMAATQALTGHGGWPMTVFLTPGGRPFYAGTYFPPLPGHGMPSFPQVLTAIGQAWREQRTELEAAGGRIAAALAARGLPTADAPVVDGELADSASSSSTFCSARNTSGAASSARSRTSATGVRTSSVRLSPSDLRSIHPIVPPASRTLAQPSTTTMTSTGTSRP
jgi:uncharacterized protein YyaL (SSP411 family)